MKTLHALVDLKNYKGIFEVVEILGDIIALKVEGRTTDFKINEIQKFCDVDGKNFSFNPKK